MDWYSLLAFSCIITIIIPSEGKNLRCCDEEAWNVGNSQYSVNCDSAIAVLKATVQALSDKDDCNLPSYNTTNFVPSACGKIIQQSKFPSAVLDVVIRNFPVKNKTRPSYCEDILYPRILNTVSLDHVLNNKNSTNATVVVSLKLYLYYLQLLFSTTSKYVRKCRKIPEICEYNFINSILCQVNQVTEQIPTICFGEKANVNPIFLKQSTEDIAFVLLHAKSPQNCKPWDLDLALIYQLLEEFKFK
ncbi:uncharacterized protein TRIADDRAFT_55660 [Trichoplax adhaerens]|uniref:Saposin B-type domain-containing protein n=1 Tax=Trichoplax adhaerens TaxID=10228 RepID=B3RVI0_TRIAD|nr:predicted protein [Trichoplax adhaerens]EDV25504.1 predicted protein [Trichoplax adhaerens]|eukprot:XP_002111537.1 predicted protein [Trichoplax adhaerens]